MSLPSTGITYVQPSNSNSSSAVGYTPATGTKALPNNTQLSTSDFLKIMVTSLKQQDPTQPQDPSSYYQQVMQMSTYQATLDESANTSKLVNQQGLNLVGKTVSYADPNNNNAISTGLVSAVNFSQTGVTATVNGSTFDVGYISSVGTPAGGSASTSGSGGGSNNASGSTSTSGGSSSTSGSTSSTGN